MTEALQARQAAERQSVLQSFAILNTDAEPGFDEIATLAGQVCKTPVALVSLVEDNRQWFKAHVGTDLRETPISQSVCVHALTQDDILVIPDLTLDPRTRNNELVTREPHVRFYAGAQLRTSEGVTIGTLCVLDVKPRPEGLTPEQAGVLKALARQVIALLELRRALAQRDEALEVQRGNERELRRDAARHQTLFDLHRKIDAAAGIEDVLRLLVDGCLDLIPDAESAVVEFREGDELVYHTASGRLSARLGHRLPVENTLSGLSLQEGRALWTGDATDDPRIDAAQARHLGLRSVIVVPIARHRNYVGVLKVGSDRPHAFEDRDVQTLQLLAAAAAAGFAELGEAEARRDVQTSEARYRTIFESAIDFAIVALDLDGCITNWNAGAQRIFGWTPDEIVGLPGAVIFTADDQAKQVPQVEMQQALSEGRGMDERWHLRKDGSTFWASGEMMTLRSDEGIAIGFVKMLRDRTAQREAEEGFRKNEERLAFAFGAAGAAGWWDWDIPHDRVYASERFAELYGIDPKQAATGVPIGSFLEAIEPKDHVLVAAAIQKAMDEAGDFAEEYRLVHGVGLPRWVIAKGHCYHDPSGRPLRFPGVAIDITARKESERLQGALLDLGDRLRDAADTSAITLAYGEIMAATLAIGRAGFATFDGPAGTALVEDDWTAPGLSSIAGLHRMQSYGTFIDDLKQGRMVVLPDVTRDARTAGNAGALIALGIGGLVNAPVIERGELTTIFFVHSTTPRDWLPHEITFIRETADRTRAALARLIAEERQSILNQEISHRMKNTLAMVQGIATQTMRNSVSLEAARDTLASRLMVFGKAHDILLSDNAESTGMVHLMNAALSLHDDGVPGRIGLNGPDLLIGRRAAVSLALMMHELATNAVKYGALSVAEGHIDVTWSVGGASEDPDLILEWREVGGPEVQVPTRKGFGSRLIERGLAGSLGGNVTISYEPTGVVCRLSASLAALRSDQ